MGTWWNTHLWTVGSLVVAVLGCSGTEAPGDADVEVADTFEVTPDGVVGVDAGDGVETDAVGETRDTTGTSDTADVAEVRPPAVGEFAASHVVEVSLEMPTTDWAALCAQRRSIFSLLGEGCMEGPSADVFTYFAANATIDGVTLPNVGVRKKGFIGSLDAERPGLRLEFDAFVDGQKLFGVERMTLNNGKQDASRLRQCLAYDLFRRAGIAAPRCAFARVKVNRVDLGLYVHVEAVKKPFLREWFGEPLGALWEGQLSDFREGWMATFEPKLDDVDMAPIEAVTEALDGDDVGLLERLDEVIVLDEFITFWAMEGLTAHWDGYAGNANNFFVYSPVGDRRLRFIPWGVDQTFVAPEPFGGTDAAFATGALAERLYRHPEGRTRYEARLRELMDSVWDEARVLGQIVAMEGVVERFREPGTRDSGRAAVDELERFVAVRRTDLMADLERPPPGFPPALRDSLCRVDNGELTATFETTWGTLPIENLFTTGTGTLAMETPVMPPLSFGMIGAKAGYADEVQAGQIVVAAEVRGIGLVVVVVEVDAWPEPGTYELGAFPQGAVYYVEFGGTFSLVALLSGELVLDEVDATNGTPVRGRLTARMWTAP
jgi:hypothetical protein